MPVPMRTLILIASLGPLSLALAACDVQTDSNGNNVHVSLGSTKEDVDGDNVHMSFGGGDADHVSLNVPGFNANIHIPGLNLSSHIDLDGVKLAPDSKVTGMDVFGDDKGGKDKDHGQVHIAFSNPTDPAKLIEYYKGQLKDNDFTIGATTGDSIQATKEDKSFLFKVSPDGSGSKGMITVTGGDN